MVSTRKCDYCYSVCFFFPFWLVVATTFLGLATTSGLTAGLAAALAYRRLKTVIAIDEDVDIFSQDSILWALATRVQWSRDSIIIDGLSGSGLDPSIPEGASTSSKMGVDATLPPPSRIGAPRAVPPVATVPQASRDRARSLLRGSVLHSWPEI